jgi:glycosyltransferase involved in cell wall biosynthesis
MTPATRRPRILFVSSVRFFGGAQVALLQFLEGNATIEPILLAPEGPLLRKARDAGVQAYASRTLAELHRARRRWWPVVFGARAASAALEIGHLIRRHDADLVHPYNFAAALYALPPALALSRPVVWHIHDIFPPASREARAARVLSSRIDEVIVPSDAVARSLRDLGVRGSTIETVGYGIDTARRFDPDRYERGRFRRALGVPEDLVLVGMCGQLARHKGVHTLVAAAQALADDHPDVRYVLVGDAPAGDAPYLEKLKRRVEATPSLAGKVLFTGWREDIPQVMKDLDVVVTPSTRPDPLPTAILQAMGMSKTVVGSRTGGIPEMIDDGDTGFLFEPGDAADLAAKLGPVLSRPQELAAIGGRARRAVESRFNLRQERDAVARVYDRVLVEAP